MSLNMHQFTGKNGCHMCLQSGVWAGSRSYTPGNTYPLRSVQSFQTAGKNARRVGQIIDGVKGKSALYGIVKLVTGVPIYYLHSVLEGVTKWLLEKWTSSTNHRCAYYIG